MTSKCVKKMRYASSWWYRQSAMAVLMAGLLLGGLSSCSKEVEGEPQTDSLVEILPTVHLADRGIDVETTNHNNTLQTKAAVDGTSDLMLYFARADETTSGTYGSWGTTALSEIRTAGSGSKTITFSSKQYYLSGRATPLKTKITGWYPGGGAVSNDASGKGYYNGTTRTVSWTIDGTQDVMTSIAKEGSRSSAIGNLSFDHRLAQVQIYVYAEDAATATAWGNITNASILDQRNTCSYNLTNAATGAITFTGTANNTFVVYNNSTGVAAATTQNNATLLGTAMIEPQTSSYTLKLAIATVTGGTRNITIAAQQYTASAAYKVYLKLKQSSITATVVEAWSDVATDDKLGEVRLGDLRDGGIVYEVNATDPTKYKVFSLDQGEDLTWSAKNTYAIGARGQSNTDGKVNVAAMKAYSTDNTGNTDETKKTTGVFVSDFPAAEFCDKKNTGGVTGWYLPAKDELVALYNAYTANKVVLYEAITASGGTAMAGYFWSSTESSNGTSYAWRVYFSDGGTSNNGKGNNSYVRCVREN